MEVNIENLKKEHGDIQTLTLKDKAGKTVATAYLKEPGRVVVARAMSLIAQSKPLEAGEFILENCFVGGDQTILENEKFKMSASMQAVQLVELLDGELKKN
ncbi:DNA binding protein [Hymenobacter swuensis]|uniref:Uncharacterized protein n=1 Tax=Hymenobacter swuensis DY53 TaxID=1227739 RepID=W8F8L1_9BACT|nr:hypothetical protein [Hymenobacter swuensis]AHJ98931.1 hypothetical protein Hsw_3336 [Hymenobacter swuensis DY53]